MKKSTLLVSAFLILALILAACGPTEEEPGLDGTLGDPAPGEIPGTGVVPTLSGDIQTTEEPLTDETPIATATVTVPTVTETMPTTPSPESGTPAAGSNLRGAQVRPDSGREDATMLSQLLGYQVVDQNGAMLGTVDDFILNLCEAHIVYVVLEADSALELEDGNLVVFPYETISLEEGVIDVNQRVITVNVDAEQFTAGPSVAESLDLTTTDWEDDIRAHWSEIGRLSNLSTDCSVPAAGGTSASNTNNNTNDNANENENDNANDNANDNVNDNANNNSNDNASVDNRQDITRIAYATEVLDMQLIDGNGNLIGEVEEVLVEPESGWIPFMAIRPSEDGGLVLVPLGALNLGTDGDDTVQGQNLVLLVEPDIFQNAPTVESLPADGMQGDTRDYWSQHVPMTREELP